MGMNENDLFLTEFLEGSLKLANSEIEQGYQFVGRIPSKGCKVFLEFTESCSIDEQRALLEFVIRRNINRFFRKEDRELLSNDEKLFDTYIDFQLNYERLNPRAFPPTDSSKGLTKKAGEILAGRLKAVERRIVHYPEQRELFSERILSSSWSLITTVAVDKPIVFLQTARCDLVDIPVDFLSLIGLGRFPWDMVDSVEELERTADLLAELYALSLAFISEVVKRSDV